jgi:hypothetical protein
MFAKMAKLQFQAVLDAFNDAAPQSSRCATLGAAF